MRVLTMGSFDPVHAGHIGLFAKCRALANLSTSSHVTVAVNSDSFIRSYKGHDPLMTEGERMTIIRACRDVDHVVLNRGGDWQPELIAAANPDVLLVGHDWASKDYLAQIRVTERWLDERGIQLVYVPRTGDISSTEIKARL